jgi:hypothetical protein
MKEGADAWTTGSMARLDMVEPGVFELWSLCTILWRGTIIVHMDSVRFRVERAYSKIIEKMLYRRRAQDTETKKRSRDGMGCDNTKAGHTAPALANQRGRPGFKGKAKSSRALAQRIINNIH